MTRRFRWSRRHAVYAAEIVLAGAVSLQLSACSVILPTTAARSNRNYPQGDLAVSRVGRVPGHPRIRIITVGGDTIAGRFGSVQLADEAEYAARYRAWRADGHDDYPDLGEEIRLDRLDDSPRRGRFAGFGARSIWLEESRLEDEEVLLEAVYRMERPRGLGPASDSMLARAVLNDLPSRAVVRIHLSPDSLPAGAVHYADREGRRANIPLNEVRGVILDSEVASVAGALLVGVAMDATVVFVIANARDSGGRESQGCGPDLTGWNLLGGSTP